MILHIDVANKIATYQKRDGCIVCGNSDYQIEFGFDSEWDGVADKTVVFILPNEVKEVKITDGCICDVPIVRNADNIVVGVYSERAGMATTGAEIPCKKSIRCTK